MRAPHAYRGFTLIELIAAITIVAVLAAVALPSATVARPFQQIGYADVVAANLRQARAMALASTCDAQFTINAAGYQVRQRAASGPHCSTVGGFNTVVLSGSPPSGIRPAANRTVTFRGDGLLIGAATTIGIGSQIITIEASGLVVGP
jgi:prepilin-type N-terminal cleavage/methylation domain-containing protein